jgi:hypothetical protein
MFKSSGKRARPTQADLLIAMLRQARAQGRPLELPEIMNAGIAQHGARFNEIRSRGFTVENVVSRATDARVLSHYYLRYDPDQDAVR